MPPPAAAHCRRTRCRRSRPRAARRRPARRRTCAAWPAARSGAVPGRPPGERPAGAAARPGSTGRRRRRSRGGTERPAAAGTGRGALRSAGFVRAARRRAGRDGGVRRVHGGGGRNGGARRGGGTRLRYAARRGRGCRQRVPQRLGRPILQREQLVQRAVDRHGPQDGAGPHVHHARRDSQPLSQTLEPARDQPRRAQGPRHVACPPVVERRWRPGPRTRPRTPRAPRP